MKHIHRALFEALRNAAGAQACLVDAIGMYASGALRGRDLDACVRSAYRAWHQVESVCERLAGDSVKDTKTLEQLAHYMNAAVSGGSDRHHMHPDTNRSMVAWLDEDDGRPDVVPCVENEDLEP